MIRRPPPGGGGFDAAAIARITPAIRLLLLHGADAILIRARSNAVLDAIVGDRADPFRVSEMSGRQIAEDPRRLADEMAAQSLIGGRRVVVVRDATEPQMTKAFKPLFESGPPAGDSLLLVDAGDLDRKSALKEWVSTLRDGRVLACEPPRGEALKQMIAGRLADEGIRIEPDALDWLVEQLGGDHGRGLGEIDKLVLYAAPGEPVTLEIVESVVGDGVEIALRDAIAAAMDGDPAATVRAVDRVLQEGESPVRLVRGLLDQLDRLAMIRRLTDAGQPPDAVLQGFRPPVFWKDRPRLLAQARRWPGGLAASLADQMLECERRCKTTGLPADVIAAQAFLEVALAGRRVSRETSGP